MELCQHIFVGTLKYQRYHISRRFKISSYFIQLTIIFRKLTCACMRFSPVHYDAPILYCIHKHLTPPLPEQPVLPALACLHLSNTFIYSCLRCVYSFTNTCYNYFHNFNGIWGELIQFGVVRCFKILCVLRNKKVS